MPKDACHKLEYEQQQIDHAAHKGYSIDTGLTNRLFRLFFFFLSFYKSISERRSKDTTNLLSLSF